MNINVSDNFKKRTFKAIFAIILFILLYLTLILLSIGLTIFCVLAGIRLIMLSPGVITISLGIGLASFGLLILFFLFKFMFKKHKVDRSHLIEVTKDEEPKLFSFIGEIVEEVQTDYPKKVYLSNDVNASVFYDSGFWSMFLPIRKNLQIGLGLVNSVTEQEFKAILAHEFGHFSQRSMKVGSYVYNVNNIIYNMLNDNESFDEILQTWSNISFYFYIFVWVAVKIIRAIQWLLSKMYDFVNVSYLALSREMEFHADEIAANVTGFEPLKDSLLRLDLANYSFNSVLDFYSGKINENIKSRNIYKEHSFVMNYLASKNKFPIKHNLPVILESELNRYNKSKLVIKDQWASHPGTDERIKALEATKIKKKDDNDRLATQLFSDIEKLQEKFTSNLFASITYSEAVTNIDFNQFKSEYSGQIESNSCPDLYNGYYDNKSPSGFDPVTIHNFDTDETIESLFSKEKVDMIYEYIGMDADVSALNSIMNNELNVKTFDYNGKRYSKDDAKKLHKNIIVDSGKLKESILSNDIDIYKYFYKLAVTRGSQDTLRNKYIKLFNLEKQYESKIENCNRIREATSFINVVTPFDQIKNNFTLIERLEIDLKSDLMELKNDLDFATELTPESNEKMDKYLSGSLEYFKDNLYLEDNLNIFFTVINDFEYLLSRRYFLAKLDLLNFQIALTK